jgi:long-chain acyl-CoA synthetase
MLKLAPEIRTRYDLSSLKVAFHAAAPCPVEVKRQMLDWWGPIIYEYYSSTETIGVTAVDPHEWLARPGTVGRAKLGELHICGEDGQVLGPRQEGVVYFSGGRPLHYHNDPEKTAAAHNDKGWATVGDIGWMDEEGYLYLTDRKSFMIISGGVNIYPQEIENALVTHPDVADAAVIGAPDEEMGEKVVAVIEPAPGVAPGEALTLSLQAHLRARISGVKMPRRFDYVERLPREPTGKLFKRLIRDRYWA